MSKTFRHTNWVLVLLASGALLALLASGALVTAYHSSSDKDQSERKTSSVEAPKETAPSKGKRTQAPTVSSPLTEHAASPASAPGTQHRSVASAKATHAQPETLAKAKTESKSDAKPSNTASPGFTNYADLDAK